MKGKVLTGLAALTLFDIAAAHAEPAFNWTGYYLGANFGYRWADVNGNAPFAAPPVSGILSPTTFPIGTTPFSLWPNTGVLGVQAGYNWQFSPLWLVGLEADFDWGHGQASESFTFFDSLTGATGTGQLSAETDWSASIRGRVGYVAGPWLLYATGGASFLHVEMSGASAFSGFHCNDETIDICIDGFATGSSSSFSDGKTLPGFVIGTGFEYMLAKNVLFRVEYLFADYGHVSFGPVSINGVSCPVSEPCISSTQSGTVSANLTTQTIRLGISRLFP
jgi:outer membrane immunogenic protein